jgi:phosphohistidine phosphatase
MRLYLMRHGQSPSAAEAGVPGDFERPLSELGRDDAGRVARELFRRGARPALILHSPLRRAAETAAEAATWLKPLQGSQAFEPLSNELSAEDLAEELNKRAAGLSEILAVGHQPQLGELTSYLCRASFAFRPAGAAAIDLQDGSGSFLWACNPEDVAS